MIVFVIVVVVENQVIGDGVDILWCLFFDLKYFKKVILGYYVIMGCKIFDSIGWLLFKRINVVLMCDFMYVVMGIVVVYLIEEVLQIVYDNDEEEVFIIGGGEIYN